MESLKIRKKDLTKPVIGFINYIRRNEDCLWSYKRDDSFEASTMALVLTVYHTIYASAIVIGLMGLEKLLN